VDSLDQPGVVAHRAAGARVLRQRAEQRRLGQARLQVGHDHLEPERPGAGAHHLDRLRVAVRVHHENAVDTGGPVAQRHRLGGGGGLVEQRGVGDVEAGEVGDHGLEVEQRLEPALGDLGLVGRVRGVPGRVLHHLAADHRRRDGVGVAEADHGDEQAVAARQLPQLGLHLGLGAGLGQVQRLERLDGVGDGVADQLLE
jgi:hypothetical protein